jgi:hypothetical protein
MPNPKDEVLALGPSESFSLPLRVTKVVTAEK